MKPSHAFLPAVTVAGVMFAFVSTGFQSTAHGAPKVTARWKFNETGASSTAADSSGFGRNLTARTAFSNGDLASPVSNTTVNFVPGMFGNAADMTGAKALGGPNFELGTNNIPNGTTSFTISGWINPRANGTFITELSQIGYSSQVMGIDTTGTPEVRGYFYQTGVSTVPSGTAPATLNQWHFVTLRYDRTSGTGMTNSFLDGVISNTVVGTRSPPAAFSQAGEHFIFGQNGGGFLGGNTGANFNGLLDDFTIWNDPLSNTEVRALYNFGRSTLAYDSETVGNLFNLYSAGSGGVGIGQLEWSNYTGPFPNNPNTNLPPNLGDVYQVGSSYYALLGAGSGLIGNFPLTPEPGSIALWGIFGAGAMALAVRRRNRARRNAMN